MLGTPVDRCPLEYVGLADLEAVDAVIDAAQWTRRTGAMPGPGGSENQTAAGLEAIAVALDAMEEFEAEREARAAAARRCA